MKAISILLSLLLISVYATSVRNAVCPVQQSGTVITCTKLFTFQSR